MLNKWGENQGKICFISTNLIFLFSLLGVSKLDGLNQNLVGYIRELLPTLVGTFSDYCYIMWSNWTMIGKPTYTSYNSSH